MNIKPYTKNKVLCVFLFLAPLSSHCNGICPCTDEYIDGSQDASSMELQLVKKINDYRETSGLDALAPSKCLFRSAHNHAFDIQENQLSLGHTGSDGSSPKDRIAEAGYPVRCVAENLKGGWDCGYTGENCVLSGWRDSPSHNRSLLNDAFVAIGIGIHGGITVANFGCDPPEAPPDDEEPEDP